MRSCRVRASEQGPCPAAETARRLKWQLNRTDRVHTRRCRASAPHEAAAAEMRLHYWPKLTPSMCFSRAMAMAPALPDRRMKSGRPPRASSSGATTFASEKAAYTTCGPRLVERVRPIGFVSKVKLLSPEHFGRRVSRKQDLWMSKTHSECIRAFAYSQNEALANRRRPHHRL